MEIVFALAFSDMFDMTGFLLCALPVFVEPVSSGGTTKGLGVLVEETASKFANGSLAAIAVTCAVDAVAAESRGEEIKANADPGFPGGEKDTAALEAAVGGGLMKLNPDVAGLGKVEVLDPWVDIEKFGSNMLVRTSPFDADTLPFVSDTSNASKLA